MFEFMALYIGSYKISYQTTAHVALANLEGLIFSPHIGYVVYNFTKTGHYIG
jgi:hypothetical protein